MSPMRVAVLISGRGSNLNALIERQRDYVITDVVSSEPDAAGLTHADRAAIRTHRFNRGDYPSRVEFKQAIRERVVELNVELVVLAGYMVILEPEFLRACKGKVINIHPSLLPLYPGLHTHERVLAAGDQDHGATVHVVAPVVDGGEHIAQVKIRVEPGDNLERLSARVLEQEHRIYPWVVNQIGSRQIEIGHGCVRFSAEARKEALELGFDLPRREEEALVENGAPAFKPT